MSIAKVLAVAMTTMTASSIGMCGLQEATTPKTLREELIYLGLNVLNTEKDQDSNEWDQIISSNGSPQDDLKRFADVTDSVDKEKLKEKCKSKLDQKIRDLPKEQHKKDLEDLKKYCSTEKKKADS